MHTLITLHFPVRQTVTPVVAEHVPSPVGRPHDPSLPQTLATQLLASAHGAPKSPAQVRVVSLQSPAAHTACASALVHAPSWRESTGRGAPAASFGLQALAVQNLLAPQSASVVQAALDEQVPSFAQAPDWQVDGVSPGVHEAPSARPHTPLSQAFATHSDALVQAVPTDAPQVFVVGLHAPDAHARRR